MLSDRENQIEDKQLLLNLKKGNSEAFDAIYEKYWQVIYAAVFKRVRNSDQAKDVVQDVFLQIWSRRQEIDIENLPAYLYTSAKNGVFDWMKREQKYIPVSKLLLELRSAEDQTDAEVLRKEFMEAYESLIDSLTPSQQEIFRMRYNNDLSTLQIAGQLDISRQTVQNQLGKAKVRLRASFLIRRFTMIIMFF